MHSPKLAAIAALTLAMASPADAFAWGLEGHAIVADIAEARLTSAAQKQVMALLATEQHSHLDEISSWADDVRPQRPQTSPWHYVDIPLGAAGYDPARDCKSNACVVAQIIAFTKVLAASQDVTTDRVEALKWVVHFVGDIHQPLHAEDDNDKGGNDIKVTFFGKSSGENLHHVWDSDIIERGLGLPARTSTPGEIDKLRAAAATLEKPITGDQAKSWAGTGMVKSVIVSWANESHKLAHDVAYADLPQPSAKGSTEVLGDDYQKAAWPIVELQLQKSGVRLAELLNEALK